MIEFSAENKLFHLHNAHVSWVFALRTDEEGMEELLHAYVGAPLKNPAACMYWKDTEGASFDALRQVLPYACPTDGRGDFRPAMAAAREASGQICTELFYDSHRIDAGKAKLPGMPATYVEADDEAETLVIVMKDLRTGLKAEISYTLYADRPVLTASVRYGNEGAASLTLERAGSVCLALNGRWDMLHLAGAWAKERTPERIAPARMVRSISSARGASGHEHNPFAALALPDTTEFTGECIGVNLVHSGDFEIAVDENAYQLTRVVAGLNPRTLQWRLNPGEALQTPEAVCVWSKDGLNGMSQAFHALYRERLCRGVWRDRERPILINNWEATYFRFNHEKIMEIAKAAAQAGIELFVLDDGWFGCRDQDNCSLGDWVVDKRKLPDGLAKLADDINALGMMFGLWFEPEMVSPDSDLYRAHPDWCLHAEGRRRSTGRQQLILDMSRKDVQDYIIDAVSSVLRSANIQYVKWDMNRNFKEAGSALLTDGREGEISLRYIMGVYRVMEEITAAFPNVLFEGCSGGGGRFDAGMLYYMPQIWTSDDTDAMERLPIQYGTSYCYPTSAMGAHVSAVPNHQVGRMTAMRTRGDVALAGNFGYELDLSMQTAEDMQEIARQVALVKKIRKTTSRGTFTRLISPVDSEVTAWQFADEERVILCVYRELSRANPAPLYIRLKGVPAGEYTADDGTVIDAQDLMNAGVRVRFPRQDFASAVMVWTKR